MANNVVVWQWQNDYGGYESYDSKTSNFIEAAWQQKNGSSGAAPSVSSSTNQLDLGAVDSKMAHYSIDFSDMTRIKQIRLNTGKRRAVLRVILPSNDPRAQTVQWCYEEQSSQLPYPVVVSDAIELAYKQQQSSIDISHFYHGLAQYKINFGQMEQLRVETGTVRKIYRQTSSYVADNGMNAATANATNGTQTQFNQVSTSPYVSGGLAGSSLLGQTQQPMAAHLALSQPPSGAIGTTTQPFFQQQHPSSAPKMLQLGPIGAPGGPATTGVFGLVNKSSGRRSRRLRNMRPTSPILDPSLPQEGDRIYNYASTDPASADPSQSTAEQGKDVISRNVTPVTDLQDVEDCAICLDGYSEGTTAVDEKAVKLNKCPHVFHFGCLVMYFEKNNNLKCPTCQHMYGEKVGDCPDGYMDYYRISTSLPGYMDCTAIEVAYYITTGIQGKNHPAPGSSYSPVGFPRIAYLPDNPEGREILSLLITAWKRKLTFTVGQSVTTGTPNCVVWNEIHHKTEITNTSGHGYPDPNYLTNVRQELAAQGVM